MKLKKLWEIFMALLNGKYSIKNSISRLRWENVLFLEKEKKKKKKVKRISKPFVLQVISWPPCSGIHIPTLEWCGKRKNQTIMETAYTYSSKHTLELIIWANACPNTALWQSTYSVSYFNQACKEILWI